MGGSNLEEKVADSARKSLILVRFWSDFAKENHVCSDSATIIKFGGVQVGFCTAESYSARILRNLNETSNEICGAVERNFETKFAVIQNETLVNLNRPGRVREKEVFNA